MAEEFYEWKQEGKAKQSYYVRFKDSRPFAFAGLWEHWNNKEKEDKVIQSCTILTTSANDLMELIHHRMPVILDDKSYEVWLDPEVNETEKLTSLLQPYYSLEMETHPVSTMVNNPRNDRPECILAA